MEGIVGKGVIVGGIETVSSHSEDVVHAGRDDGSETRMGGQMLATVSGCDIRSVPVEQRVGDGFKVLERDLAIKMKNFHLAFVLRVIDHKQVHRVVCKHTAPLQIYVY